MSCTVYNNMFFFLYLQYIKDGHYSGGVVPTYNELITSHDVIGQLREIITTKYLYKDMYMYMYQKM